MRYIQYVICFVIFMLLVDTVVSRKSKKCCPGRKNNKRHKKVRAEAGRHAKIGITSNITSTTASDVSLEAALISSQIQSNNRRIALERYKAILQLRPGKLPGQPIHRNKTNKWTEAIVEILLNLDDKIDKDNASEEVNTFRFPITKTVGKFGYHSIQNSVSGKVIHIKDKGSAGTHFGCSGDIANKEKISPKEPWIALVSRGKCRFLEKIKLAERLGAIGVVVYDNDPSGNVEVMSTIGTKITSLMINADDGTNLAQLINKGQKIYMNITVGKTHTKTVGSPASGNGVQSRFRTLGIAITFLTTLLQTVLLCRL